MSILMSPQSLESPVPEAGLGVDVAWQPWHEGDVVKYLAEGRVVFVDVTADWCITCKVNKRFVINDPMMMVRLGAAQRSGKLVMLQADWTRPDQAISRFLAQHDRFGIPFNSIFSASHPSVIILPELLTTDILNSNLDLAGLNSS